MFSRVVSAGFEHQDLHTREQKWRSSRGLLAHLVQRRQLSHGLPPALLVETGLQGGAFASVHGLQLFVRPAL
eukprot:1172096-Rhodomonas_salina.2